MKGCCNCGHYVHETELGKGFCTITRQVVSAAKKTCLSFVDKPPQKWEDIKDESNT